MSRLSFKSESDGMNLDTLNLSWTERELPESVRTKHVHRLHPYLGKFIPQLVEIFLKQYSPKIVCDPFCGSGTTLVEANSLGINSIGADISKFNCLLSKVKTDKYDLKLLEMEIKDIVHSTQKFSTGFEKNSLNGYFSSGPSMEFENATEYLKRWFSPRVLQELIFFKSQIKNYTYQDVLKIILSRSARSARLTTHFDLDFPKKPQTEPYYCFKHKRTCYPTNKAIHFLRRYAIDTIRRITEFSKIRTDSRVQVFCEDSRKIKFPNFDMILTSPPYFGLIDYHDQHKYAFELLDFKSMEEYEIGAASNGKSLKAKRQYIKDIGETFSNAQESLSDDGVVVIIVNDKDGLYDDLAPKIGFKLVKKLVRAVNRRTGRRASNFSENILIWRKE